MHCVEGSYIGKVTTESKALCVAVTDAAAVTAAARFVAGVAEEDARTMAAAAAAAVFAAVIMTRTQLLPVSAT